MPLVSARKKGDFSRLEVMKGRSQRLPAPAPPMDDWGDGEDSWTVDCTCGVNYDDGEEMVNCDDCGVWVHTRCSRYVKEEESFTCDKCKAGGGNRNGGSNSNEEAEVAELLAELPTKGDRCPPPPAPSNHLQRAPPARLWFEAPMEERVHIQGLPGGDPSIFEGNTSSVFTANLWKACGYIPKKFNFKYREFRCWNDDDVENPANTGADVLFSLSKETVLPGPSMTAAVNLPRDTGGIDGKAIPAGGWLNPVKKERNKLRGFVTSTGKRKEDDPARMKDKAAKKAKLSAKATPGDKAAGSPFGFSNCNSNVSRDESIQGSKSSRDESLKGSKTVPREVHGVNKRKEPVSDLDAHLKMNGVDDSMKKAVTSSSSPGSLSTVASQEKLSELNYTKPEKVHKQQSQSADISSAKGGPATSVHTAEHDSKTEEKDDYADTDGLKQNKHSFNLNVSSSTMTSEGGNSKLGGNELRTGDPDKTLSSPDLDRKAYSSPVEVKIENDTSSGGDGCSPAKFQPFALTCSDAVVKAASSCEEPSRRSPIHFADVVYKNLDNDRETEVTNQTSSRILSIPEQRQEEPAGRLEVREGDSKMELGECHAQESSRSGPMNPGAGSPRGIKRACSSAGDTLVLPIHKSDTNLSAAAKTPFQKRMKINTDIGSENERVMKSDTVRDNLQGETSDSFKSHLKSSRSSLDKLSPSSKTNILSTSKHKSSDLKEHKHLSSSKTSSTENSGSSSGSGKHKISSRAQSSSVPIKFRNSMSHRKGEKNSSNPHISAKTSGSAVAALPPNASSSTLSDEELAKRLHQELNSSPRVSRAPRGFHAAGMQFSSPGASSMLSKRSSSSNTSAKAQDSMSKKDPRRDDPSGSFGDTNLEHLQSSVNKKQETRHVNGSARRDSHSLSAEVPSAKKNSQPSSFTGPTMRLSSSNL